MRADSQPAGAATQDDSGIEGSLAKGFQVMAGQIKKDDAALVTTLAVDMDHRPNLFQAVACVGGDLNDPFSDGGPAEAVEEFQAFTEGNHADHVLRAPFVPPGIRFPLRIDLREFVSSDNAVPADPGRLEQVQMFQSQVKDSRPLRPKHPFVAVGAKEVDLRGAKKPLISASNIQFTRLLVIATLKASNA